MNDIPVLYTAFCEWLSCLMIITTLPKRKTLPALFFHSICAFGILSLIFYYIIGILSQQYSITFWIPGMLLAVGCMGTYIFICSRVSFTSAIFYTTRAFIYAEFVAALEWQLHSFYIKGALYEIKSILFVCVLYACFFSFLYFLARRHEPFLHIAKRDAGGCVMITGIIFLVSNLSYIHFNSPFQGSSVSDVFYIRTLVDFCGVIFLLLQEQQQIAQEAKMELASLSFVVHQQYDQYKLTKDNMDLINRKYHDLKHQITLIRNDASSGIRENYLNELEQEIAVFHAQYHTGNEILDTILSGKAMNCIEHGITLQAVCDGSLLKGMDVMDICSIFGNALDNAIEYLQNNEETGHRLLQVTVCAQNAFTLIRFENYCSKALVFKDGLPVTTKGDTGYHGYGVKSMRSTVEKYQGTLVVNQKDNWFRIHILIPS